MAAEDFAILVGISKYSSSDLTHLKGPPRDVQLMRDWLLDVDGGNVPEKNIRTLISPVGELQGVPRKAKPDSQEFADLFREVVSDENDVPIRRMNSRLYLFFSGHGYCDMFDENPNVTLYAANASQSFPHNIPGTTFALRAKTNACFGEIILIMDCCRDADVGKGIAEVAMTKSVSVGTSAKVKLLTIYGSPKGGKALERPIPHLNGEVYGLLTAAVVKALRECPLDALGARTGERLKSYIQNDWKALCGDKPVDLPEITPPAGLDIQLTRNGALPTQGFDISELGGGDLNIRITNGVDTIALCTLPANRTNAKVQLGATGIDQPLTVAGSVFQLSLNKGLYLYEIGKEKKSGFFQIPGAGHVRLKG